VKKEVWAPVVGYEGIYEVSSFGRVRSLDRVDSRGHARRGRIIRQASTKSGHLSLGLHRDGEARTALVHRVVARAFLGEPPEGTECCHADGDPENNNVENLRWDSRSANLRDAVKHGTHHATLKRECPRGHPLERPNLVLSTLKRGWRSCLACKRASKEAHRSGIPLSQELADKHFGRIA
jgi:hypothetical protein